MILDVTYDLVWFNLDSWCINGNAPFPRSVADVSPAKGRLPTQLQRKKKEPLNGENMWKLWIFRCDLLCPFELPMRLSTSTIRWRWYGHRCHGQDMSRWLQDATGYCSSIAIKMVTLNCHQVPLVMVQAKKSIGTEAEGARLLQEAEEEQQNESFFLENTRIPEQVGRGHGKTFSMFSEIVLEMRRRWCLWRMRRHWPEGPHGCRDTNIENSVRSGRRGGTLHAPLPEIPRCELHVICRYTQ